MADWGWGFTRGEVKDIIQDFLTTNSIETPFIDSRPSKDWLHAFLQRNPKITPRKTEHLSNSRSDAENPETIKTCNNTLCPNCGGCRNIGDQWVCCDVCDIWYHLKCTTITELDNVKVMEWKCSDCSKPL
nr:PHD finger protein ALFIN-LIKE 8-like [Hydra vulgaris]